MAGTPNDTKNNNNNVQVNKNVMPDMVEYELESFD